MILTLNAGSSSVKFAAYQRGAEPVLALAGQVENIGTDARLVLDTEPKRTREIGPADHMTALSAILDCLRDTLDRSGISGVGHRIVHGGTGFSDPLIMDDDSLARLADLVPLAPLHQPHNLAMVAAAQRLFPDALQVGCFDTAFHHGHPWVNDTFALPKAFYEEGVRRYGFHGLSYEYITACLARDWPELAAGRVVVAHLGNGASMCAIRDGQSVASTMGFTALDGLPMGTRCGQLDPGVVLYLLKQGYSDDDITRILYRESGLKGLSGISHDMRTLLGSSDPDARNAIDYYVFRIRRELGGMAAVLGGIDTLVFCGGIGENAPEVRAGVIEGMAFLGLALDAEANRGNRARIGKGAAQILVIPTDEEIVIARATNRLMERSGAAGTAAS